MDSTRVSAALRERLGDAATAGLLQLFNDARREWMADSSKRPRNCTRR